MGLQICSSLRFRHFWFLLFRFRIYQNKRDRRSVVDRMAIFPIAIICVIGVLYADVQLVKIDIGLIENYKVILSGLTNQ